jgi:hypothetical protein
LFSLEEVGRYLGEAELHAKVRDLVIGENTPVRRIREKFQHLFRFGAQKPGTGLKLKINLFSD